MAQKHKAYHKKSLRKKLQSLGLQLMTNCQYTKHLSEMHSSITKGNEKDLERVQKAAIKVITNKQFESYGEALETLGIES